MNKYLFFIGVALIFLGGCVVYGLGEIANATEYSYRMEHVPIVGISIMVVSGIPLISLMLEIIFTKDK
jgi:hypothetical protein